MENATLLVREYMCDYVTNTTDNTQHRTFDRLATLFFNTQSNTIKSFMSDTREILWQNALIFGLVWFIFTCMTSGVICPAGIFMPCILIGCALGQVYSTFHNWLFVSIDTLWRIERPITPAFFSILGATAVLCGATRMTFALAVIMLETTASVDLFMPIIFTLFVAYGIGYGAISKSVYSSAMRSKNIPLLNKSPPEDCKEMAAFNLMHSPVISFNFIVPVHEVYRFLENTEYNGFPVLNGSLRPVGIIERDALIVMIKHKVWYRREALMEEPPRFGGGGASKDQIVVIEEEDQLPSNGVLKTEGSKRSTMKAI
jgi:chloride channel 7